MTDITPNGATAVEGNILWQVTDENGSKWEKVFSKLVIKKTHKCVLRIFPVTGGEEQIDSIVVSSNATCTISEQDGQMILTITNTKKTMVIAQSDDLKLNDLNEIIQKKNSTKFSH
jgi:hypothetical protein